MYVRTYVCMYVCKLPMVYMGVSEKVSTTQLAISRERMMIHQWIIYGGIQNKSGKPKYPTHWSPKCSSFPHLFPISQRSIPYPRVPHPLAALHRCDAAGLGAAPRPGRCRRDRRSTATPASLGDAQGDAYQDDPTKFWRFLVWNHSEMPVKCLSNMSNIGEIMMIMMSSDW